MGTFTSQLPLKVTSKMRILKCNHSYNCFLHLGNQEKYASRKSKENGIENNE